MRFALYLDGLWSCERKGTIGGNTARCLPNVFTGLDIESEGVWGFGAIEGKDEFLIDDDWGATVAVNWWVGMFGVRPDDFTIGRQAHSTLVSEVSVELCSRGVSSAMSDESGACVGILFVDRWSVGWLFEDFLIED